ncbi:hypothetical protein B0H14DRAFT_1044267 [Mycena olivaceomarginata]|nr:hypothetical protein B0H14DRAFT_1044267 [Mycena olivaceomarginata]
MGCAAGVGAPRHQPSSSLGGGLAVLQPPLASVYGRAVRWVGVMGSSSGCVAPAAEQQTQTLQVCTGGGLALLQPPLANVCSRRWRASVEGVVGAGAGVAAAPAGERLRAHPDWVLGQPRTSCGSPGGRSWYCRLLVRGRAQKCVRIDARGK